MCVLVQLLSKHLVVMMWEQMFKEVKWQTLLLKRGQFRIKQAEPGGGA